MIVVNIQTSKQEFKIFTHFLGLLFVYSGLGIVGKSAVNILYSTEWKRIWPEKFRTGMLLYNSFLGRRQTCFF